MKHILLFLLLLLGHATPLIGNMSSPIWKGTRASTSFVNKHVEIVEEKLHVSLSKDFKEASYIVQYQINALKDGIQIPIVFLAKDYKNGFQITMDGKAIATEAMPPELTFSPSDFEDFKHNCREESDDVVIQWEHSGSIHRINNLKYFRTDLTKGEHTIEVRYTATSWVDVSDWVSIYSFRYALAPAKHWKQFGSLEITLDASKSDHQITTNLGPPTTGNLKEHASWVFKKIPANTLQITHTPKISKFAQLLIWIGPMGIAGFCGLLAAFCHLLLLLKINWQKSWKRKMVLILGSLLVPLLFLFAYIMAFGWIDWAIGPAAGGWHGYVFFILVLYPVLALVYWLLIAGVWRWFRG